VRGLPVQRLLDRCCRLRRSAAAQGKSRRDATRLLKRYLARHLYRLLQQQEPLMA
jgi:hypothetical protein